MKVPGKSSILSKLSNLNQSQKGLVKSAFNKKSVVSIDLNDILYRKSKKTFSVKFINYVEPYEIGGVRYTLFHTEVDHNLSKGERVFIVGGNYDSDLIIQGNPFNKLSDGYIVQYVDRTKVVLDIEWSNKDPWEEDPVDDYIKIYVASSQDEFDFLWKTVSGRGTIPVSYLGVDEPFLSNRFAYDPISGNSVGNILYSNGTFDTYDISYEYDITGNTTYSNTFTILEVDPTVVGSLTVGNIMDITPDILSGSYSMFNNISSDLFKIIGGSFEIDGNVFEDGYVYYFDTNDSKFKIKREHTPSFITEQNFRNGRFGKGNFNQGLLGSNLGKLDYYGDRFDFNLGTILNVNWHTGSIFDGFGTSLSHYTSYDGVYPSIKVNGNNNAGYGYSYAYNTNFISGSSKNGNFFDSVFGLSSSNNVVYNDAISNGLTYSFYNNGGNYFGSKFDYVRISNSLINNSNVHNSKVDSSRSINSEFTRSTFDRSKFISDNVIKIQNYSEHILSRTDLTSSSSVQKSKLYKFYISEKDFQSRLDNFDSIYFNIDVSGGMDSDILNFFDDKFTIGEYRLSYDEATGKVDKKVLVQLSTKEDNKYIPSAVDIATFSTHYGDTLLKENPDYGLPSVDIIYTDYYQGFSGKYHTYIDISGWLNSAYYPIGIASTFYINTGLAIPYVTTNSRGINLSFGDDIYDLLVYLNDITGGENWTYDIELNRLDLYSDTQSVVSNIFISTGLISYVAEAIRILNPKISISGGYIIDSDFKSGIFKNSEWVSGNYINYNKDYSINTNSNGYYLTSSVATASGDPLLSLSIKNQLRYDIIEPGDISYINGFHYDTTLNGGDNLVRLNDTYIVKGFTSSTPERSIELIDILGTSSVIYNVPPFTNSHYLITKNAENNYNYIHPVKFQNSKIKSGIFRRSYFSGCEFSNQIFNNLDRNITKSNVRNLLITDSIFDNSKNIIKSGIFRHSSFAPGSDSFENGIIYNSIWNGTPYTHSTSATGSASTISGTPFKNGIFKNSRWVYGLFDNGLFLENKTNTHGFRSVINESISVHWRKDFKTRYAWIDGIFNNGQFELSNWENGTFDNGEFFNSVFMSGEVNGGFFGRRNIPFSLTKILSGTFSNADVVNAEFRSQHPTGDMIPSLINWISGKFNGGIFGVFINGLIENYPFESNWYGGEFNGGKFTDISKWYGGKFNGGKFNSYYGMPFTTLSEYRTSSSPDNFAWEGGEFNGGEFGNFSTGLNSTWYSGEFNGGIFSGRYWKDGVFTRGSFIGSGTSSTDLSNIPNYVSDFSDDFYGLWESGNVTELKDNIILDKKFYTKLEREFSKKKKKPNVDFSNILWMGGTFSHSDGVMKNSVWIDGTFEKGTFENSSFNPYVNYIVNSNFDSLTGWEIARGSSGSVVSNSSNSLDWSGTSSTTIIYQTPGLEVGSEYTMSLIINDAVNTIVRYGNWITPLDGDINTGGNWQLFQTSLSSATLVPGYPGYISLLASSGFGEYCMIFQENILESNKVYSIRFYYWNSPSSVIEVGTINNADENTFAPDLTLPVSGYGLFSGTFSSIYEDLSIRYSSSSGSSDDIRITGIVVSENSEITSVGPYPEEINLSFTASGPNFGIEFISIGTPTPTGPTWPVLSSTSIDFIDLIKGESGFNLSESCIWKGGIFKDSEFFISKWLNGRWLNGTSYGMIWENGVSNYMNAYNTYWGGGLWRNGNWNGSPFNLENVIENQLVVRPGFTSDILTNVSLYRQSIGDSEYQDIFINNAFTQSSDRQVLSDVEISNGLGNGPNNSVQVLDLTYGEHNWEDVNLTEWSLFNGIWYDTPVFSLVAVRSPDGILSVPSNLLYAIFNGDINVFTSTSHQYDISIEYSCYYGPVILPPILNPVSSFKVSYGDSTNGGNTHTITDEILNIYPTSDGEFFGRTKNQILNYTFSPTNLNNQLLTIIRLSNCDPLISINILSISIIERSLSYDHDYNNATYSIMAVSPQYGDVLELPPIELLGGANSGGQISTQFGNGMFESGTFSSVWENGVWNQGLRYDRNVLYFDDLSLFSGTNKPLSFKGSVANNGTNEKSYSQNTSNNLTYQEGSVSHKTSTWILSLRLSIGTLEFEDDFVSVQDQSNLSELKVGDLVSVGNIVAIDINDNRRILREYLTVVRIENDTVSLQFSTNFPLRRVQKDSDYHLIYVSKNIWLNGAFLNGKFRGIWNNGLFRGYPYITNMVDTQWIDGRFEGGRFRGLTHSYTITDNTELEFHSGLIQNFNFIDNDVSISLTHSYNSWIDVNYNTFSSVAINRDGIRYTSNNDNPDVSSFNYSGPEFGPVRIGSAGSLTINNPVDIIFQYPLTDTIVSDQNGHASAGDIYTVPFDMTISVSVSGTVTPQGGNPQVGYWAVVSVPSNSAIYPLGSYPMGSGFGTPNNAPKIFNNDTVVQVDVTAGQQIRLVWFFAGITLTYVKFENLVVTWTPIITQTGTSREISYAEFYSKPTVDVLQSKSRLRNNSDFGTRELLLGEKYKDYVTNIDLGFDRYYDSSSLEGIANLQLDGFVWSSTVGPNYIYSNDRIQSEGSMFITFSSTPFDVMTLNNTSTIQNRRYSYISFDILEISDNIGVILGLPELTNNNKHIDNLINNRPSFSIKEYFFNKKDMEMLIISGGNSSITIDNLKFVETDMVPFFQLGTESNINQSIQFPLQAISPFINYSDSNFSLIDNLNVTETVFTTIPASTVITPGGVRLGGSTSGGSTTPTPPTPPPPITPTRR